MPSSSLKSIEIVALRGSAESSKIEFRNGAVVSVIYGPNGSGKTTICDAFDLVGNEQIGSILEKGLGVGTRKYWAAAGKTTDDIAVTVTCRDETSCTTTVPGTTVNHAPLENRLEIEVLRRSDLVKLIEATPGKRYEALQSFVDVGGVEKSEASLKLLLNDLTKNQTTLVTRISENDSEVDRLWAQAGNPGSNAMAWAREQAQRDLATSDREAGTLKELSGTWSTLTALSGQLRTAIGILKKAQAELDTAISEQTRLAEASVAHAAELVSVLTAAQKYVKSHVNPEVCPLCESSDGVENLSNRVDDRLTALADLSAAQKAVEENQKQVAAARTRLSDLEKEYAERKADFEGIVFDGKRPSDVPECEGTLPKRLSELETWLKENADRPEKWRIAEDRRREESGVVEAVRGAVKAFDENVNRREQEEHLLEQVKRVHEIVKNERQAFTQAIFEEISERVSTLYETMHPGENISLVELALDAAKRSSAELNTVFCGVEGSPPQAYLSESHTDTLGLCIYLALAERRTPEDTVLVLDDVIASVDEPHVERIVKLLYEQGAKFRHCLITTHYRPWREKFSWGELKDKRCQLIELRALSDGSGFTAQGVTPETERLRAYLADADPDIQTIGGKAGVILEALLEFLTLKYGCSVPRRYGDRYTLGDLLPAINKKLLATLSVEVPVRNENGEIEWVGTSLSPLFKKIGDLSGVRNLAGCHFNEIAASLDPGDTISFGTAVLQLADQLICPKSGWPSRDDSGTHWATPGDTRRLHPLKKPS